MSLPARALLGVIWIYRKGLSPVVGRHCRYYPTCSAYAAEAIRSFGALRGSALGLRRVLRCHPWAEGGVDPVPTGEERAPGMSVSSARGDRDTMTRDV